jgi:hypothetical protein
MKTHGFIYLFIVLASCLGLIVAFVSGIATGLTYSQDDFELNLVPLLSMLGVWVGAFATCSAVIVSLWLALKQLSQDKEVIDCRLNMMVIPGHQDDACIGLSIVSKGTRPASIASITWHGKSASTAIYVQEYHQLSDRLPKVLSYGETMNILHVPNTENYLRNYVINNLDGRFEDLYLSVNTTTESKNVKLGEDVLSSIRDSNEC